MFSSTYYLEVRQVTEGGSLLSSTRFKNLGISFLNFVTVEQICCPYAHGDVQKAGAWRNPGWSTHREVLEEDTPGSPLEGSSAPAPDTPCLLDSSWQALQIKPGRSDSETQTRLRWHLNPKDHWEMDSLAKLTRLRYIAGCQFTLPGIRIRSLIHPAPKQRWHGNGTMIQSLWARAMASLCS